MYVQGRDNIFADALEADCKRKSGAKGEFRVFDLSNSKAKFAIDWDEDNSSRAG